MGFPVSATVGPGTCPDVTSCVLCMCGSECGRILMHSAVIKFLVHPDQSMNKIVHDQKAHYVEINNYEELHNASKPKHKESTAAQAECCGINLSDNLFRNGFFCKCQRDAHGRCMDL